MRNRFLQETHLTIHDENQWSTEWDGNFIFSHGSDVRCQCCFTKKFPLKIDNITHDIHERALVVDFNSKDNKYTAINFYNTNAEQDQVDSICSLTTAQGIGDDGHTIFTGDLNLFFRCSWWQPSA